MKTKLKYFKNYLDTDCNFQFEVSDIQKNAPKEQRVQVLRCSNMNLALNHGKLHLRPLSDLTDEFLIKLFNDLDLDIVRMKYGITINYKMMGDWFKEHISLRSYNNERCLTMSAWLYVALLENHIDVFGLIDKGLAVIEKDEIYQSLI